MGTSKTTPATKVTKTTKVAAPKATAPATVEAPLASIATINPIKDKKTGQVLMSFDIESILVVGRVRLNSVDGGKDEQIFDLGEMNADVLARLFSYGVGRHGPDNLTASSPDHFENMAGWLATNVEGYMSPKEKKAALAPKAAKRTTRATTSREEFESWLSDVKGLSNIVEGLAGEVTEAFWEAFTTVPAAAKLLEEYKNEQRVKQEAKKAESNERATAFLGGLFDA